VVKIPHDRKGTDNPHDLLKMGEGLLVKGVRAKVVRSGLRRARTLLVEVMTQKPAPPAGSGDVSFTVHKDPIQRPDGLEVATATLPDGSTKQLMLYPEPGRCEGKRTQRFPAFPNGKQDPRQSLVGVVEGLDDVRDLLETAKGMMKWIAPLLGDKALDRSLLPPDLRDLRTDTPRQILRLYRMWKDILGKDAQGVTKAALEAWRACFSGDDYVAKGGLAKAAEVVARSGIMDLPRAKVFAAAMCYAERYEHLDRFITGQRDKILARRKQGYAMWVKACAQGAASISYTDSDFRSFVPSAAKLAACPSELTSCIKHYARRTGIPASA